MEKFYWDTIRNAEYSESDSYNRSYDSDRGYDWDQSYDSDMRDDMGLESFGDYDI